MFVSEASTFAEVFSDSEENPSGNGKERWDIYHRNWLAFRTNATPLGNKPLLEEAEVQLEDPRAGTVMIAVASGSTVTLQSLLGLKKY